MAGILGYKGHNNAFPFLVDGLNLLINRGFESIGISVIDNEKNLYSITSNDYKKFSRSIKSFKTQANMGLAHTCWNHYHGINQTEPEKIMTGINFNIALYGQFRSTIPLIKFLTNNNIRIEDNNDYYLIVRLIEFFHQNHKYPIETAFCKALSMTDGAVSCILITSDNDQTILGFNRRGALTIGLENGDYYIASDLNIVKKYCEKYFNLGDNEVAIINQVMVTKDIKDL